MQDDLQNELYEKYPTLFENRHKPVTESCMAFGIECGDGWYSILSNLCWEITQHESNLAAQQKYSDEEPVNYSPVRFDQIKEKFGGLRVYYTGGDEFVRGLVSMADAISYSVCEACGEKGKPNEKGWIATLCDNCRTGDRIPNKNTLF
jgi:hypothetical protein